jgi:hypothetical protein
MPYAEQEATRGATVAAPGLHPDIEVLFAQARRRRRRRRLLGAAVSLVLAGAVAVGVTAGRGGRGAAVRGGDGRRPPVTATSQSSRLALPAVRLACVDNGSLVISDPATGALHVGPAVDASSSGPLVSAAGQLYWADANTDADSIRDYDLATGKIRYLPAGLAVFTSADGRSLYIARNSRTLLEMPADGSGRVVVLRAPAGWFMSRLGAGWAPTVAAGGVIVSSSDTENYVPSTATEGVWNPATGQVRILGVGIGIFGIYTPPGAHYSLVAWAPPSRDIAQDYALRVSNTLTGLTVAVRSPLRYGFVAGGAPAFSPDGTQMAVFVRTASLGSSNGMSQLAIADTRTGTVHLVPGTALYTTEDAFWAMWLPGSERILAGAVGSAYAVDARTLTARPFSFLPSTDGFSAVVLPAAR